MFRVYEEFKRDGKRFFAFEHTDKFECECWIRNHESNTNALMNGKSKLVLVESED